MAHKKNNKRNKANKKNAQHSTGPTSQQGLAVSSKNALKLGAYSEETLVKGESQSDFDAFAEPMLRDLDPQGEEELYFAKRYIAKLWRLEQMAVYAAQIDLQLTDVTSRVNCTHKLTRAEKHVEDAMWRAKKELDRLQAQREKIEAYLRQQEQLAAWQAHQQAVYQRAMQLREAAEQAQAQNTAETAPQNPSETQAILEDPPEMGSFCEQDFESTPSSQPLCPVSG